MAMVDCGEPSPGLITRVYSSFAELPGIYRALDREAGGQSFYTSRAWFGNLAATALEPGSTLVLLGVEQDRPVPKAVALLPAQFQGSGGVLKPRTLTGLAAVYTTLYGPMISTTVDDIGPVCRALASAIRRQAPVWDMLRFDALDGDSLFYAGFADALKSEGLAVQKFFHFGNWFEEFKSRSAADYLKERPSILRNTIKRKTRKLEKSGAATIELFTGADALDKGLAAYDAVYAASWKTPEPFPDFTPGLMREAAGAGALRLGTLHVDGEPAAAQIWIVAGGCATIFKLAYDERFKKLSVGSILSYRMMQHVIEVDGVREVDFGRGDDPYKEQWLRQRRERWGIVAYNPSTALGWLGAAKLAIAGWLGKS